MQPNQEVQLRADAIIRKITDDGEGYVFESCKSFDEMAAKFSMYNDNGDKKAEDFLNYTKELYQQRAKPTIEKVENCDVCLGKISSMTGFDKKQINLQKALSKKTYDEFLFTLLFDDCKFRDASRGFRRVRFPQDDISVSNEELREKIKEGLTKGHPVLFPNLCMNSLRNGKCVEAHSVVISGYKKIFCNSKFSDSFKIHNSWGKEWQKLHNDGWVSADNLLDKIAWTFDSEGTNQRVISRGSVIWLE